MEHEFPAFPLEAGVPRLRHFTEAGIFLGNT